jgi:hypothetical protein
MIFGHWQANNTNRFYSYPFVSFAYIRILVSYNFSDLLPHPKNKRLADKTN